jgi:hypothetical protein
MRKVGKWFGADARFHKVSLGISRAGLLMKGEIFAVRAFLCVTCHAPAAAMERNEIAGSLRVCGVNPLAALAIRRNINRDPARIERRRTG